MITHNETMQVYESIPLDLPFLNPVEFGPVIYGYGGCSGKIVLSPAPVCIPYFPTNPPPTVEIPPPWHPPHNPPETPPSVPLPSTLILLVLGLAILKKIRR